MSHAFPLPALVPVAPPAPPLAPDGLALEIVEEAVQEAAAIRRAAHEEGLRIGRAELADAAAALHAAAGEVRAERARVADDTEAAVAELGLAIGEQVIGAALDVAPERVLDAVRGALRVLAERHRVTVLVHPDDLGHVREGIEEVRSSLGGIEHVDVQAERRLQPGGALVRTAQGTVDASPEAKLGRVREVLREELRGHARADA